MKKVNEKFSIQFVDREMLKYTSNEKILIQGAERFVSNTTEIVIISFPRDLHWLNPIGKPLIQNEKLLFTNRVHEFMLAKNLAHEVRMYSDLPDLNMSWFYGYGENDFFRVFNKMNLKVGISLILKEDILNLFTEQGLKFNIRVEKIELVKGLFTKRKIPVFHMNDSSMHDGAALDLSTQIMLAQKVRIALSMADCSFDFRFKYDNSNSSKSFIELPSFNNLKSCENYSLV